MVGDSVKLDPDALSPSPPNLGVMDNDGNVFSRREEKESDIHAWINLNRVFNPTTISGKIHRSDGIRPPFAIGKEGSRQGGGKSLMAALDHNSLDMQMQCRREQRGFPEFLSLLVEQRSENKLFWTSVKGMQYTGIHREDNVSLLGRSVHVTAATIRVGGGRRCNT